MVLRLLWDTAINLVRKPIRNFNVIERAEKRLDLTKSETSPRHPGTEKKFEKLVKENPQIKIDHETKPEDLLNRLKIVKVSSTDESPKVGSQETRRPLPQARSARSTPHFGFEEPSFIPEGKCTLQQALEFITKIQTHPEDWTIKKIAEEYKLHPVDVENIVKHFKAFCIIQDTKLKKGYSYDQLEVLGAQKTILLEPKYGDNALSHSSEELNNDPKKS